MELEEFFSSPNPFLMPNLLQTPNNECLYSKRTYYSLMWMLTDQCAKSLAKIRKPLDPTFFYLSQATICCRYCFVLTHATPYRALKTPWILETWGGREESQAEVVGAVMSTVFPQRDNPTLPRSSQRTFGSISSNSANITHYCTNLVCKKYIYNEVSDLKGCIIWSEHQLILPGQHASLFCWQLNFNLP